MRAASKGAVLFAAGGAAYGLLELAWRGRTHWTMLVLGGLLFLLLGLINETALTWDMPLALQGVIGAAAVTAAELAAGLVLNVWLGLGVWDYSRMPFNLLGQICLPYSLLWVPVSIAAIVLDDYLRHFLFGEEELRYSLFRRLQPDRLYAALYDVDTLDKALEEAEGDGVDVDGDRDEYLINLSNHLIWNSYEPTEDPTADAIVLLAVKHVARRYGTTERGLKAADPRLRKIIDSLTLV